MRIVAYRIAVCRWRRLARGAASHRTNRAGVGGSRPWHAAFCLEQVGSIAVFYRLVVPDVADLVVSARVGARYFRDLLPDRNSDDAGCRRLCCNRDRSSAANEHRLAGARGFRVLRNAAPANRCASYQLLAGHRARLSVTARVFKAPLGSDVGSGRLHSKPGHTGSMREMAI
jgi:hypothetical protein